MNNENKTPIRSSWGGPEFNPIGKTIASVWINPDRTVIKFAFTDGTTASLATGAECCSETWIEHVSEFNYAIGATITYTYTTDIGEVIPTRQECDQLYSASIGGSRADYPVSIRLDIEFRNSSNGYYGGNIEWTLYDYDVSGWSELTEDF